MSYEPISWWYNKTTGIKWNCVVFGCYPFNREAAFFLKKSLIKMNVKLFVGNLPNSMTRQELGALFDQAGEVIVTDLITDRNNGESKGFAFVTMGSRSEAERAIHMFNTLSLNGHQIKVNMAKPSIQF